MGEGLSLLAEDSEPGAAPLLLSLAEGVEAAMALAPALEQSGVFPDYYLRMVHLGEETGCLDEVMEALARHYDREQAIRDTDEAEKRGLFNADAFRREILTGIYSR